MLHSPLTLFVVQAVVIVAISRIIGMVARRLGQPMVIAEVVAGIFLGPSLFGMFFPNAYHALFPAESLQMLNMFSQVGLIFFMFLIGLELDPRLLHGRGRTSVIISHSSIVTPFALGSLLAYYLYSRVSDPSVRFSSFLLFMGVAMSITAFPVLARILSERRLMRTRIGAITIACAAVDDVTAWCILAFVVSIVRSTGFGSAGLTTVYALAYVAFMIFFVRVLLSRLGARTLNRENVNQNLVAATFILLLLSSLATELIGIHALFGAFLFGAIMPREGGYSQALAEKLEDFVVVLLLPLFFAYSGLRTQIGLLNSGEACFYCVLITLTACLGKFGGGALAARFTGLSWRDATAIGILMNTRGLMELIVLNIGLDLKVLSPSLFTMMVIMALVTTFITTPLLRIFYSDQELKNELEGIPELPKARSLSLLLCVAHPRTGPSMAMLASALIGKKTDAGRVVGLRLLPVPERTSTYLVEEAKESKRLSPAEEKIGNPLIPLIERAEQLGLKVTALSFVSSEPADDICHVAEVKKSDLVLLGWHKPLISQSRLGGIVYEVMAQAKTDVGVLIDRGLTAIKRVLVPYSGSFHDLCALRIARRLNREQGATITILHVVPPNRQQDDPRMGAREKFNSVFNDQVSGGTVGMKVVESDDSARAALTEAAGGYDLIIVGCGSEWGLEQRTFVFRPEVLILESVTSLLILHGYEQPQTPATQRA